jgi:hypothetical protein
MNKNVQKLLFFIEPAALVDDEDLFENLKILSVSSSTVHAVAKSIRKTVIFFQIHISHSSNKLFGFFFFPNFELPYK